MRRALALGIVLAITLSGCAGRTPDAPRSPIATEIPDATPTATEAPIARTGLTPPEPIFGGDCSRLFSDDEMSEIAGTEMEPFTYDDGAGFSAFRQLGVITCTWIDVADRRNTIDLTVLWNDVAPDVPDQSCGKFVYGEGVMSTELCLLDAESHGVRIGGDAAFVTEAESMEVSNRLISAFHSVDRSDAAGQLPTPVNASWATVLDCDALPPLVVNGESFDLTTDILGSDGSDLPVTNVIMKDAPTAAGCYAESATGDSSFGFQVLGGGAWRFDEVLDRFGTTEAVESVSVPQFEYGFVTSALNTKSYYLVSGPNYLEVQAHGDADGPAIAVAVAEMLY